jgi:hypothetical protein
VAQFDTDQYGQKRLKSKFKSPLAHYHKARAQQGSFFVSEFLLYGGANLCHSIRFS